MALRFDADLRVEVDGVPAEVTGEDGALVVTTPRPLAFLRAARTGFDAAGGAPLAALTGRLAREGGTIRVDGPSGTVLTVGAGASPRLPRPKALSDVALPAPRVAAASVPRWVWVAALVGVAGLASSRYGRQGSRRCGCRCR